MSVQSCACAPPGAAVVVLVSYTLMDLAWGAGSSQARATPEAAPQAVVPIETREPADVEVNVWDKHGPVHILLLGLDADDCGRTTGEGQRTDYTNAAGVITPALETWALGPNPLQRIGTNTRSGNRINKLITISCATMNGTTPTMMSSMVTLETPQTTLSVVPTGGVTRPMALLMMNTTPK